jgi:hypothetical protein
MFALVYERFWPAPNSEVPGSRQILNDKTFPPENEIAWGTQKKIVLQAIEND